MTSNIVSVVQARNQLVDFDINDFLSSTEMKERITEFQYDPLVLACSLKDLVEKQEGYYRLDEQRVIDNITPEIEQQAEEVRKYYTRKFFWNALSNNRALSDYRRRLINLLENRIRSCKDQDCGIYYKLPFFYEEDQVYDDFKKQYMVTDVPNIHYGINKSKEEFELSYLKSTYSTQRKRRLERFWFSNNKYLFQIEVDRDNPLIEMFKTLLEANPSSVKLEGYRTVDRIDQMYFYKLYKFNFRKN
jgi:hypothetical protein